MLSGRFIGEAIRLGDEDEALDDARRNLNTTVFFGISDHWNTSVCLFHKELNGPGPRPAEFVNVRPAAAGTKRWLTNSELATVHSHTHLDRLLYTEALQHFLARAERYGCDVPELRQRPHGG